MVSYRNVKRLVTQLCVLLGEHVTKERRILLLGFEGGFEGSTLGGVSKGGLGVGVGGGELGTLGGLGGGGFFGGRIADLAGEHFAVLTEEIHVRVSADFAGHGLDEGVGLD